ncbi:MAG: hypothetical protein P8Y25_14850 [Chromatiaceae bacterium]
MHALNEGAGQQHGGHHQHHQCKKRVDHSRGNAVATQEGEETTIGWGRGNRNDGPPDRRDEKGPHDLEAPAQKKQDEPEPNGDLDRSGRQLTLTQGL